VPGLSITCSWTRPPSVSPSRTCTHLNLSLSASQPQPLGRVHTLDYLASFSAPSWTYRPVHRASRTTSRLIVTFSPLTSHLSPSYNLTLIQPHPHTTSPSQMHGPHFVRANSLDCLKSLGELFNAHPNMNIRLLWLPRNIHGRLQEGETAGSRSHLHHRP
jgi:hypothetical protein